MAQLYPDNWGQTIEFVANTGGAAVGTIYKTANAAVYLAVAPGAGAATTTSGSILTVTSGHTVVGFIGKVRAAPKLTGAWVAGDQLAWDGTVFTTVTTATRVVANAAGIAAAANATGDVILCLPNALSPA